MKLTPLILTLLVFAGCATKERNAESKKLLSRETKVCVLIYTSELRDRAGGTTYVSETIEKFLVQGLNRRGIVAKSPYALEDADARLVVQLNTIDLTTVSHPGWVIIGSSVGVGMAPSVSQRPCISFTVVLTSPEGVLLFQRDVNECKDRWEPLTEKIGDWISKKVASYYSKDSREKTIRDHKSNANPALSITTGRLYRLDDGSTVSVEFEQNGTGHGFIKGTSTSGETFKGEYSTLANAAASDPKAYPWAVEMGFSVDSPNLQYGTATAVGDKGTTIEVIYTVNPSTGHGSGVGKDGKGNKYRLQF